MVFFWKFFLFLLIEPVKNISRGCTKEFSKLDKRRVELMVVIFE
jgi:hypothetical protein